MIALLAATALAARLGATDAIGYDFYKSGRPRRVVAAYVADEERQTSELRLLRLPNNDHGKPVVLDRDKDFDIAIDSIEYIRLVDDYDFLLNLHYKHPFSAVERVRGDKLVRIAEEFTQVLPDFDHDGVPEVLYYGYVGPRCGGMYDIEVFRWNGTRYRKDKRHYVAMANRKNSYDMELSPSKHYMLRLYGKGHALLDDKMITPGKLFTASGSDCHTFAVKGAKNVWAFLEERP